MKACSRVGASHLSHTVRMLLWYIHSCILPTHTTHADHTHAYFTHNSYRCLLRGVPRVIESSHSQRPLAWRPIFLHCHTAESESWRLRRLPCNSPWVSCVCFFSFLFSFFLFMIFCFWFSEVEMRQFLGELCTFSLFLCLLSLIFLVTFLNWSASSWREDVRMHCAKRRDTQYCNTGHVISRAYLCIWRLHCKKRWYIVLHTGHMISRAQLCA